MKPGWGRIDAARIGETVASLKDAIVPPTARALVELQAMLTGALTFTDNFKCSIIERNLVHGVEQPVSLGFKPIGVYALRTEAVGDGSRYALDSLDWQLDVPGGTIGVTAKYDLSHTTPYLFASKSANQSNGAGVETAVTWDTLIAAPSGSTLSSGEIYMGTTTRIMVRTPGLYRVDAKLAFALAAGGNRYAYQKQNASIATGNVPAVGAVAPLAGDITSLQCNGVYVFSSTSDYVEVFGNQTSGGAVNILGGANFDCALRVTRVCSLTVPTNTVTLLCVGG